jgi:flagellar biosynthetic protein FliR
MEPYALPAQVYAAGLVFLRVGALIMLIPGIGDNTVPPRIRLSFALLVSLCMGPIAYAALPALPATLGEMGGQALKELIVGLLLGGLLRFFLSSLAVAGEVVALQTTLAFAQTANPLQAQPGTALSSFLTLLGVTLIFSTGLHHMFIGAIARSYTLFAPAKHVLIGDAATLAVQTMSGCFALGIQMAAPVIVFSLVFNLATGLIGRVMPQFQIFFVATPLNILLGLSIFALTLGVMGLVWIGRYEAYLRVFN